MNWRPLQSLEQLEEIKRLSHQQKILIYKHSTTCGVSSMALKNLERSWNDAEMQHLTPYFLDLHTYRPVSNQVADDFQVRHESPQVLVIEAGKAIYHTSHHYINYQDLQELA
jgi:bacillithiol system protein YtxJ